MYYASYPNSSANLPESYQKAPVNPEPLQKPLMKHNNQFFSRQHPKHGKVQTLILKNAVLHAPFDLLVYKQSMTTQKFLFQPHGLSQKSSN